MKSHPAHARQTLALRLAALVMLTGLPGVLLPGQALEKFSWFVGYGQPRLDPLSIFMTADAASASVLLGLILGFLARDPERYQPLVRLLSRAFLVASPVWISLGLQCPLPWWWTASAAAGLLALGLALRAPATATA
jgi:hypothetical protein